MSFLNVSDLSNEQFDPATYKEFAETEVKNFWYVSRPKLISIVIKKYLKDAHNFLEIGCGTGYVLYNMNKKLPNLELYGADVYVEGLEFVKKRLRGNIKLYQFDAKNIPFENHFDLIGAFDAIGGEGVCLPARMPCRVPVVGLRFGEILDIAGAKIDRVDVEVHASRRHHHSSRHHITVHVECPVTAADSTGRRNGLMKSSSWCLVA